VSPFWGPWAPNLLFLLLSLGGLMRIGRETETSRGGGWADLSATVRAMVMPWKRKQES
jgi:hypothetical protein